MGEATGALLNLDAVSLEHKSYRVAKVVVKNNSDLTPDAVPIIGVYFDDSMAIVGGTYNPIIGPVHPGSGGSLPMHTWWGVKTDRYLIAAFGSGNVWCAVIGVVPATPAIPCSGRNTLPAGKLLTQCGRSGILKTHCTQQGVRRVRAA